jgi:DNA-binding beta-propeller fold protein YncE
MKPIAAFPVILALTSGLVACGGGYRRPVDTTPPAPPGVTTAASGALRDVVLVGNNWAGTVAAFDPITFQILAVVDVVPDWDARIEEIKSSVIRKAAFDLIREVAGEGHNQLVDDVFTSLDGRYLFASRPSFADVVAIELDTRRIAWRTPVEGSRADHAAISPDGRTLLVSASTARKVHAIETATGRIVGSFESGDEPHESNYSPDGLKIYHASIGRVFLPISSRALDFLKGDRVFQVVDAATLKVLERFDCARNPGRRARSGSTRRSGRWHSHRTGASSTFKCRSITAFSSSIWTKRPSRVGRNFQFPRASKSYRWASIN